MLLVALAALSAAMAAEPQDWVPMRWPSSAAAGDPKLLDILNGHPVNCLLVDDAAYQPAFAKQAETKGIAVLRVDRATGAVKLGERKVAVVAERHKMDWSLPIAATQQGVWPGVRAAEANGNSHSAASGSAWIDTNAGFLRFARAAAPAGSTVWIANDPPAGAIFPLERYLQAIGDAAMTGSRWVLSFDADFSKRLFAGEAKALREWKRVGEVLRFYEAHKEWRGAQAYGKLALVQSAESGALVSGGVLDMIAVKHTPVNPVPPSKLEPGVMKGALMAVNIDPDALKPEQKEALKAFTRAGGTLLTGPPGWKFPDLKPGQIVLGKEDLAKLDEIWKEMNSMIGRRNLGARLFNVSSMLSNLQITADGKRVLLHLVNYADFPVDSVTVHLLGSYKSATIFRPEKAEGQKLDLYPIDEGVGLDVDLVTSTAVIVLEP